MTHELPVDYTKLSQKKRKEVREQYVIQQNFKCHYCKHDLRKSPPKEVTDLKIVWKYFPPNFLLHPIHLQHNHNTGMTEGAVHAYCNAVLWQYHGK